MSYSAWVAAVTIGLAAFALPQESEGQEKDYGADQQVSRENWPFLWLSEEVEEASRINRPCPEGEEYRYSDLCAQWKAADAAADAVYWTEGQFWLGAGGLMIGILTLAAAAAAAWYAKIAGEAAQETVAVTREIGREELAPFCSFPKGEVNTCAEGAIFDFWAENIGKTPAIDVFVSASIFAHSKNAYDNSEIRRSDKEFVGTIPAGETRRFWLKISSSRMTPEEAKPITDGRDQIFGALLHATWRDIYGEPHEIRNLLKSGSGRDLVVDIDHPNRSAALTPSFSRHPKAQ